jgi:hypothetical protein
LSKPDANMLAVRLGNIPQLTIIYGVAFRAAAQRRCELERRGMNDCRARRQGVNPEAHKRNVSVQRDFDPGPRTARATVLTIPHGDSDLIETRWERQRLRPLNELRVVGADNFPWDIKLLFEAREAAAIIHRNSQHINNRRLFAVRLSFASKLDINVV